MAMASVHPGNSLSNDTQHPVATGQLPAMRNEMIDLDIWRAAHVMIEAHGDQAERQAALKARQMLETGDPSWIVSWNRIATAIVVLRVATPSVNPADR
jgi:hypothetical protein